jgi:protein-tyrosine phosphatase
VYIAAAVPAEASDKHAARKATRRTITAATNTEALPTASPRLGSNPLSTSFTWYSPSRSVRHYGRLGADAMGFNYSWIVPNLAQGNFPGTAARAFEAFDVVVLCAEEHQPRWKSPRGKYLFKLPLDDDPYQSVPYDVGNGVLRTALAAGSYHMHGHPLITTCHQGHNRSGICTGIILMDYYGMSASEAIDLIRERRNDDCIGNPMFEQFLHNLDSYR